MSDLDYIISKLPKDAKKYLTPILSAYRELKRADALGLYGYLTYDDYLPQIENEKNYPQQLEKLKKDFERLKPVLPHGSELINVPRKPIDIKIELEKNLSGFTTAENIKIIIETIFGTGAVKGNDKTEITIRNPRKNAKQKFDLSIAKLLSS